MDDSPTAPKSALAGTYAVKPDKAGRLRFRGYFAGEQEHWVRVTPPPAQNTPAIDFRLFSLQPDLFRRRPFKGDFHIHSNRSDIMVFSPSQAIIQSSELDIRTSMDIIIYSDGYIIIFRCQEKGRAKGNKNICNTIIAQHIMDNIILWIK